MSNWQLNPEQPHLFTPADWDHAAFDLLSDDGQRAHGGPEISHPFNIDDEHMNFSVIDNMTSICYDKETRLQSDLLNSSNKNQQLSSSGSRISSEDMALDSNNQYVPKVSDADTFGPRFCEIFTKYNSTLSTPIDTNRHLMTLCLEQLIPFCQWARSSEGHMAWMRERLFEHDFTF